MAFDIQAPAGIAVVEQDPLYRPFLRATSNEAELTVPVTVSLQEPPAFEGVELFDTGEAWAAVRDCNTVWIRMRHADPAAADLWTAALDLEKARMQVWCGPVLRRDEATAPAVMNPLHYPLDQLVMAFLLPPRGGFVVHAAGVIGSRGAVACLGVSGAGKTTLARLLAAQKGCRMLSDDRLVLRVMEDQPKAHGTPWAGEGRISVADQAPLHALVFLRHASHTKLSAITPREALDGLLKTSGILWFDPDLTTAALAVCEGLLGTTTVRRLDFTPDESVVVALAELGI